MPSAGPGSFQAFVVSPREIQTSFSAIAPLDFPANSSISFAFAPRFLVSFAFLYAKTLVLR